MTATYIAEMLRGRRCGKGYIARCPAHKDATPSLSIRDLDGRILVHCFAGCTQEAVLSALRGRGLWPEPPSQNWTLTERREYCRRHSQAEAEGLKALAWRNGMIARLQKAKALAYGKFVMRQKERSERSWADACRQMFWFEALEGTELARNYRRALRLKPGIVKRLIAEAEKDAANAERTTNFIVTALCLAGEGAE